MKLLGDAVFQVGFERTQKESQRLFTLSEWRKGQKFTPADSLVSDIRPVWETHFGVQSLEVVLAAAAHTEHYSFITTYFCSPFISRHMLREEIRDLSSYSSEKLGCKAGRKFIRRVMIILPHPPLIERLLTTFFNSKPHVDMMRLNQRECPKSFSLVPRGFPNTQSQKQSFYL